MKGMLVLICLSSLMAVSCSYIGLGGDDDTVEAKEALDSEVDEEYFGEDEFEDLFAEQPMGPMMPEDSQDAEYFDSPELGPVMPTAAEAPTSAETLTAAETPIDVLTTEELTSVRILLTSFKGETAISEEYFLTPEELEGVRTLLSSLRGQQGPPGGVGLQGNQGPQGPAGPEGPQGKIGLPGNEGPTGPQGPPGLQGYEGTEGSPGIRGNDGNKGERGDNGLRGDKGATGEQGPAGEQGIRGLAGDPGGPKGDTGAVGPIGPQGLVGATGSQGDKGDQGGIRRFERVITLDGSEAVLKMLDAECTGDDRIVIGGGFQYEDERVTVYESLPRLDGKGWRVKARGPDEFWQLRAYAMCIFDEGE